MPPFETKQVPEQYNCTRWVRNTAAARNEGRRIIALYTAAPGYLPGGYTQDRRRDLVLYPGAGLAQTGRPGRSS